MQNHFSASSFPFSPFPPPPDTMVSLLTSTPPSNTLYATFPFDPQHQHQNAYGSIGHGTTALTPGAQSQGSHGTTASEVGSADKDPFLLLLEQLAENEQNPLGGPSELDFFLASGNGYANGENAIMTVDQDEAGRGPPNGGGIVDPSLKTVDPSGL